MFNYGAGSPKGIPFIGDAAALSREGLEFLRRCAREYGGVVPLRFFWKPLLFVNRPDLIEAVLTTHQRHVVKDVGQRADRPLIGNGLFLNEGDSWLRQRRLMQPAFHRERIAAYADTMVEQACRLTESWRDGEERDVYRDMSQVTMSIVARTLFGADVWREAAEIQDALSVTLDCLGRRVRSLEILLPDCLPTPTNRHLEEARRRLDAVIFRMIRARCGTAAGERSRPGERGDLLSMLLDARDEHGRGMTHGQVRDEVMTFLVGGYETAADSLAWTWLLLGQYPRVAAAMRNEVDAVLGGRRPSAADVPALVYTGMVVNESLRLYPPAPALGREAIADFEIEGHRVRRGTDILVSQWVMHRDERYFPGPESFRPERWEDGLAERLPRFAYFPFGGGPRLCIGHAFAMMEMVLILATIAQRWRLELVPAQRVEAEMLPTLRPKNGIRVVVRRRG